MGSFSFFSRKPDIYKVSDYLLTHPFKDKYFYRLLQYDKFKDGLIYALDKKGPRWLTFDPWPQLIFLNASGLKTIHQFTIEAAQTYRGQVPRLLEQTIMNETETLIAENVIALSEHKISLAPQFLYPVSEKKSTL